MTKAKALSAIEILNKTDVMDDGQRFCFVGPHQWNELTNITEFASADYVGESFPFLKGMQEPRRWLNVIWIYSTQLTLSSGTRYVMMWHRSAMGLGEGMDDLRTFEAVPFVDAMLAHPDGSLASKV